MTLWLICYQAEFSQEMLALTRILLLADRDAGQRREKWERLRSQVLSGVISSMMFPVFEIRNVRSKKSCYLFISNSPLLET
ncbi:unnamed protein product [Lasius platythorax]|uniref:Uncharacterized protein n=1 Tax=Lasius platythorax TaxID=488582 RepID=A0AAV2NAL9_9HYME